MEELKHSTPRIDWFSKIVFPLVALIVAGIGAFTSWNAFQLSKYAFDLNVEPLLNAFIVTGHHSQQPSLRLHNEGINPIYDVHIKRTTVTYNWKKMEFGFMGYSSRDWQYKESVLPQDSVIFQIPAPDMNLIMQNTYAEARMSKQPRSELLPVVAFHIRYRRMPDKKLYNMNKYLYLLEDGADTTGLTAAFVTQEEPMAGQFLFLEPKLDSLSARAWKW